MVDLVTWGVFLIFVVFAGVGVFFISVYGTTEQSFEDGLVKILQTFFFFLADYNKPEFLSREPLLGPMLLHFLHL